MDKFYWFIIIPFAAVFSYFASIFLYMMFIAQITQLRVKLSKRYKILQEGILIKELPQQDGLHVFDQLNNVQLSSSKKAVLLNDEVLESKGRFSDEGKEVHILEHQIKGYELLFDSSQIYQFSNKKKQSKIAELSSPKLRRVSHISSLDFDNLLLIGAPDDELGVQDKLYQINIKDFQQRLIAEDVFLSRSYVSNFEKTSLPLLVVAGKDRQAVFVVYYSGKWAYGFGGDVSRPKYSVVRIYNQQYPQGKDIVKFGLKAGVIEELKFADDKIFVRCDPGQPTDSKEKRKKNNSLFWIVSQF